MANSAPYDHTTPPQPPFIIAQPQTLEPVSYSTLNIVDQKSLAVACPQTPRPAPVRALDVAQNVASSSRFPKADAGPPKPIPRFREARIQPGIVKTRESSIVFNSSLSPPHARDLIHRQRRRGENRERQRQEFMLEMIGRETRGAQIEAEEKKARREQEFEMWPSESWRWAHSRTFDEFWSFDSASTHTQSEYTPNVTTPNVSPRGSVVRLDADMNDEDMVKQPHWRVDSIEELVTPGQYHLPPDLKTTSEPIDIPRSSNFLEDLPNIPRSPNIFEDLPPLVPSTHEPHPGSPVDFTSHFPRLFINSPTRNHRTQSSDYHIYLASTRRTNSPQRFHFASDFKVVRDEAAREVEQERASKQAPVVGLTSSSPRTECAVAAARERGPEYRYKPNGGMSEGPTLRKARMSPPSLTRLMSTSPGTISGYSMKSTTAPSSPEPVIWSQCTSQPVRTSTSTPSTSTSSTTSSNASAYKFLCHVRASNEARAAAEIAKKKSQGSNVFEDEEWMGWLNNEPL